MDHLEYYQYARPPTHRPCCYRCQRACSNPCWIKFFCFLFGTGGATLYIVGSTHDPVITIVAFAQIIFAMEGYNAALRADTCLIGVLAVYLFVVGVVQGLFFVFIVLDFKPYDWFTLPRDCSTSTTSNSEFASETTSSSYINNPFDMFGPTSNNRTGDVVNGTTGTVTQQASTATIRDELCESSVQVYTLVLLASAGLSWTFFAAVLVFRRNLLRLIKSDRHWQQQQQQQEDLRRKARRQQRSGGGGRRGRDLGGRRTKKRVVRNPLNWTSSLESAGLYVDTGATGSFGSGGSGNYPTSSYLRPAGGGQLFREDGSPPGSPPRYSPTQSQGGLY